MEICYNKLVVTKLNWKDYITSKYLAWREDKLGRSGSAAQFAREIGITPQLLSDWMNKGQVVGDQENINKLVSFFGFEIYDVLGFEREDKLFMDSLKEALEKSKSISREIGEILDQLLAYELEKTKEPLTSSEKKNLQERYKKVYQEREENYRVLDRLTNGAIHQTKSGIVINPGKMNSPKEK